MITALALAASLSGAPSELGDYLAAPDPTTKWEIERREGADLTIALRSQTWHGFPWNHSLALIQPKKLDHKGLAVLVITGWVINPADLAEAREIADRSGMAAAVLFDIPNQPLFDLREDDLIAHTFERFLDTGDATWPLLFPMAKSAIKAMDALQDVTKGTANPLRSFVVTGQSKRGWTTWFVGAAGDKRVKGIAPMIIDNLNLSAQMPHQLRLWGKYSDMIEAYTSRGLQSRMNTPAGRRLTRIVDPYSYRERIKAPTLIVNGSNDPYWATDALSLYWPGLSQPKSVLCVPNAHHDLGDKKLALPTLAAFARAVAGEFRWPTVQSSPDGGTVVVTVKGRSPTAAVLWRAESATMDFRGSRFKDISRWGRPGNSLVVPGTGSSQNQALFVQLEFEFEGRLFSLCTPTWIEKAK